MTPSAAPPIGFCGQGPMGAAMVERLLKAGPARRGGMA